MIGMTPKDADKLDTVKLDKKTYYLKMVYIDIYINVASSMEIKKDRLQTLSGLKIRIS